MDNLEAIIWDFDGVLINSNPVRELGFREVLSNYPEKDVEKLIDFHKLNGGLSRYVKFKFFFEIVRGKSISEDSLKDLSYQFSLIMREKLVSQDLLITETISTVKKFQGRYSQFIASGSDQRELRYLCKELNIDFYFNSIFGSPKPKNKIIFDLLDDYKYTPINCLLVGDSINDFEAAHENGINFIAYNNPNLEKFNSFKFAHL